MSGMGKEKRPQDWSPEEKLAMGIRCGGLSEEDANKLCREQGLYTHYIQQWKEEFVGRVWSSASVKRSKTKQREY